MPVPLKLRYTLSDVDDVNAKVVEWVQKKSPKHVIIRHNADGEVARPHWHALVYATNMAAFRTAFSKAFPDIRGNAMYSMGTVNDGEEEIYVRYMCHSDGRGHPVDVVSLQHDMYGVGRLGELNEAYYAEQDRFRKEAKSKKKDKSSTVDEVVARLRASADIVTRHRIAQEVVNLLAEQRRPVMVPYCRGVTNAVCVILGLARSTMNIVDAVAREENF